MSPAANEFSVPVRDLDAAGKHFRFAVRASWLRRALEATDVAAVGSDGELDVRLSKSGNDVVVRGSVRAELSVPCARCLEPARIAVREELSVLAVPMPQEVSPDQADVITYDGETLVLDDLVRDELLLAIPMIPLCSEACPGIRPQRAEEPAEAQHIDPRLSPLLSLKTKI